ncbi:hypothetical protein BG011_001775 [Mortierella polycephala]|uniref:Calcium-transporting ATPase n=1 Tax=Mortierella polycephala TaxID=41804 RepID=A0A9P6QGC1_9FUNG|nr:hypothetical protein BG011_001775 [Mortierella polycephala]
MSNIEVDAASTPKLDNIESSNYLTNNEGTTSSPTASATPQYASTTVATLADPRPANYGPFSFTPDELMALIDPKAPEKLEEYGGIESILAGLHTDPTMGLTTTGRPLSKVVSHGNEKVDDIPHGKSTAPVSFEDREQYFGRNVLPKRKPKNIFQLMWMALHDKILILLLVAAVVSIALGLYEDFGMPHKPELAYDENFVASYPPRPKISWVEGVAILVAVGIVVLVGSINDFQKEAQFRKLNAKKEDREVKVLRNGETVLLSVFDIAIGDILHLEPGDVISTDGVFLGGHNLKCDESAMTGESDAVKKVSFEEYKRLEAVEAALHKESKLESVPDHSHALHGVDPFIISGSKVIEGVGLYVVTGVGVNSFHGKTMMSLRTETEDTPLQQKLNGLAEQIAKLGSLAALVMLVILFIRYFVGFKDGVPETNEIVDNLVDIAIAAVTVVVVAVPEGLPLAVTLALAFATTRMLKDNNLVRVLAACETMGNATTICSDKTGTLTQNRMTIVAGTLGINTRFIADVPEGDSNQRATIPINKLAVPMNQLVSNIPAAVTQLMHEAIAINSSAFESEDEKGNLAFIGSKTEVALLDFSKKIGGADYRELRDASPVAHLYPFSSERKSMATIVQMGPSKFRLHAKGASEIIMKRCNKVLQISSAADQSTPLSEKDRNADVTELELNEELQTQVHKTIISYATQSLRTIGIAYRDFESWPPAGVELNADGEVPFSAVAESDMILIGVVGIEDPLREGVPEAVLACQRAGVLVRMVTGDNILTAKSIATQCGIYTQGGIIMEGPKFRALSAEEMDVVIPRLQVLARSSPEDKKILVGRLKALGEIVAVTGDGTNDGPALKMSDVGFSMGIAGTEVAKEASAIILMDDNFSSIVKAILWGRAVNDAVKKFLQFQLTVNVTAVVLTLVTAVASEDQKPVMSAVQLLWINLIMDTLAALALATDPPTLDLLDRQPEPRTAPLISFTMWKMICGQAVLQLIVTFVLEYAGMYILGYNTIPDHLKDRVVQDPGVATAYEKFKRQELSSMVFNTFVFLQIFNEVNCRRLDNRLNIFAGISQNRYFSVIFVIMVVFQILIIEFGGKAFKTEKLDGIQWIICVVLGLLSMPVGVAIRLIPEEIFGGLKDWVNNSNAAPSNLPDFTSYPASSEPGRENSMPASIGSRTNSMSGSGSGVYPSRDGLVWNPAVAKVRSDLSVFKSIRGGRLSIDSDRSGSHGVFQAGAMVPCLVASSIGGGLKTRVTTPGNSLSQVNVSNSSPRSSMTGSRRGTQNSVHAATPQESSISNAPVHTPATSPPTYAP